MHRTGAWPRPGDVRWPWRTRRHHRGWRARARPDRTRDLDTGTGGAPARIPSTDDPTSSPSESIHPRSPQEMPAPPLLPCSPWFIHSHVPSFALVSGSDAPEKCFGGLRIRGSRGVLLCMLGLLADVFGGLAVTSAVQTPSGSVRSTARSV